MVELHAPAHSDSPSSSTALVAHPIVSRARQAMEDALARAVQGKEPFFASSPLAGAPPGFLEELLADTMDDAMDLSF